MRYFPGFERAEEFWAQRSGQSEGTGLVSQPLKALLDFTWILLLVVTRVPVQVWTARFFQ